MKWPTSRSPVDLDSSSFLSYCSSAKAVKVVYLTIGIFIVFFRLLLCRLVRRLLHCYGWFGKEV